MDEFTEPEDLREETVAESRAPLGVFAEMFPDFTPPFLLREGTEARREATTALLEGTFPLFTQPAAKALPPVATIYPPPI